MIYCVVGLMISDDREGRNHIVLGLMISDNSVRFDVK